MTAILGQFSGYYTEDVETLVLQYRSSGSGETHKINVLIQIGSCNWKIKQIIGEFVNSKQALIPSPCTRNCCLNEQDVCLGCFRTLTEITGWGLADDHVRKNILLKRLQRRKAYYKSCSVGKQY